MGYLNYRRPQTTDLEPHYGSISSEALQPVMLLSTLALSLATAVVVFKGAAEEPYLAYRREDALVQVGLGTALIVLWVLISAAAARLVARRKLFAGWLILLGWAAICVFYLIDSPLGYLQDIERFVIP